VSRIVLVIVVMLMIDLVDYDYEQEQELLGDVQDSATLLATHDFLPGLGMHNRGCRHFHVATGANVVLQSNDGRIPFALEEPVESIE
jgi:hypothetical protein